MKLTTNDKNQIVATAENAEESVALIHLAHQQKREPVIETPKRTYKKRRKAYKQQPLVFCQYCGKTIRGNAARAVHEKTCPARNWKGVIPVTQA